MIRFPCLCHFNFSVEDDMAGREIQCPQCGRLNDVPTSDQLGSLRSDGTIQVDASPIPLEDGRVDHLIRAFSRQRVDNDGVDIDLRNTPEEIARAGVPDAGFALVDDPASPQKPVAPKYDPVTGELIRPIELRKDQEFIPTDQIPMATPTLAYARPDLKHSVSSARPLTSLFQPINLVVMFFVLIAHGILSLITLPMVAGVFLIVPLFLTVLFGIFAHYANVIEEVGPEDRDELPRLMRHMSFTDDFWNPSIRILLGLAYCFTPAALVLIYAPHGFNRVLSVVLAGLGAVLFPAALITTTTSGNLESLRPDRVLGVISTIGVQYLLIFGLFISASAVYALGIYATWLNLLSMIGGRHMTILSNGFVAYGLLLPGIYLMHAFTWYLGLMYRAHHADFPWVHQRHIRTTQRENIAVYAANRALRTQERAARRAMFRRTP